MKIQEQPMYLKLSAVVGAIAATWAAVALAVPLLQSEPPPFVSKMTVVELEQQTVRTFQAVQSGYWQSAVAWCEHYRREAAKAEAASVADPANAALIEDRDWYAAQRDLWCSQQLAPPAVIGE